MPWFDCSDRRDYAVSRFVILRHDHPTLHRDLMLEVGTALWTWRLDEPLCEGGPRPAARIADHRPMYLDYEGPVSGGRGTVWREGGGNYEWLEQEESRFVVRLSGPRWCRTLTLTRVEAEDWAVHFAPDRASDSP